ncbi:Protein of unknown function [Salimicrobium album]|uniref:DUF2815 family protein n=1 Tax=Salimicrobium album TaxID=50717 RepID=A0A1H3DD02_9BACI|nr:Protein of unknown function [Salimicrobium album]
MAISAKRNGTKVITGEVRASYANVWEPQSINGSDEKYSVSLIISKEDTETIKAIEQAIEEAKEDGKAKFGGKIPNSLKTPLRDGDEEREDDEAYKNSYFINANRNASQGQPQIVDAYKNKITDTTAVYSGCFIRASVNFFAFNTNGNKGIAAGLGNIQKIRDGEMLSGGSTADEDFDELDTDDDDLI